MLARHIDAIALLVIVFALAVVGRAREPRFEPRLQAAAFRVHNAIARSSPCPFSGAWIPHLR